MAELPEFDNPPVAEVSIGVQFRPLIGMRGLSLAPLRERWLQNYPRVEEQAALAPVVEGAPPAMQLLQFNLGPLPPIRQWFLNDSGTELIQVQPDRLIVNWRAGDPPTAYPRYSYMREVFEHRFGELVSFAAEENLGEPEITQAELSYVNVFEAGEELGRIDRFLKGWSGTSGHHLGEPEQARVTLTYLIPGIGHPPVRLYVEVSPAQKITGEPVLFFTLTVRGNPGRTKLGRVAQVHRRSARTSSSELRGADGDVDARALGKARMTILDDRKPVASGTTRKPKPPPQLPTVEAAQQFYLYGAGAVSTGLWHVYSIAGPARYGEPGPRRLASLLDWVSQDLNRLLALRPGVGRTARFAGYAGRDAWRCGGSGSGPG